MKTHIDIGQNHHYELHEALLIYRSGQNSHRGESAFVTRHTVETLEGLHAPILGPAQPLTLEFVHTLNRELGTYAATEVFPANVVARTERLIAWWTGPLKLQMFFGATQGNMADVNGSIFPQPPLLWMVKERTLFIRALSEDRRPEATTRLCFAPYWNVYETGSVCLGSARVPSAATVASIEDWELGFFESAFTHGNVGRVTRHPGGFEGLWKDLAGEGSFPPDSLIELPETLAEFLQGKR